MNQAEGSVFFIDDEKDIRLANEQTLTLAGFNVCVFERAEEAMALLDEAAPSVIICDLRLPGLNGHELLTKIQQIDKALPVIIITGHGDISMAVQAMHDGAYDFIEKPFSTTRLIDTVRRAYEKRLLTVENRNLRQALEGQNVLGPRIIGKTPVICALRAAISKIARTSADVLIFGETGTGKELVARSLHEQSQRRDKNFVALNCGAVPENLIESELFGHEKGAFTGAEMRRIGKFEHAHGGTLFLDEIESMPLTSQVSLLRVLEERTVERLGSNETIKLDIRVIAATKVDLKAASRAGDFREDLYYRLNVLTLEVPALAERSDDIPLLFQHFIYLASAHYGVEAPAFPGEQLQSLMINKWSGNVRELRNAAERFVLLGDTSGFDLTDKIQLADTYSNKALPEKIDLFERALIEQALVNSGGTIKVVMERLGLPRKTLYDKMKKYGLDKAHYK